MSLNNLNDKQIINALLAEVKQKKVFNAAYNTECEFCWNGLREDDEFYFFGNKEKMCARCKEEIESYLEVLLVKLKPIKEVSNND